MLLLPEVVDDYVGPDNPVRFIEAFIEGLDCRLPELYAWSQSCQVVRVTIPPIC